MSNNHNELKLTPRITEIVSLYFNDPSQSYTALAKSVGVSVARVSAIMNHPKVLAAYPILARSRIKSMVPKAVHRLERLMNQNENYAVSEKVVSKILDSEKVLEPSPQRFIHEIQMKSVSELQEIIDKSKALPQVILDAEIISEDKNSATYE